MIMPILITSDGQCFGSIVYEEFGTDHLTLEFYTSNLHDTETIHEDDLTFLHYPQRPLDQKWIVEYPLIAYKHYSPQNREIVITNIAHDTPQKVINLGESWEFVHFVKHTAFAEK